MKQTSGVFLAVDLVEDALDLQIELDHLGRTRGIVAIGLYDTAYLFAVFNFDEHQIGVSKQQVQVSAVVVSLNRTIRKPEQHYLFGFHFKYFYQVHKTLLVDERLTLQSRVLILSQEFAPVSEFFITGLVTSLKQFNLIVLDLDAQVVVRVVQVL